MSTTQAPVGRRGARRPGGGWAAIITPPNEDRMPAEQCGAIWPWGAAPSQPATGVPLGHECTGGGAVFADPVSWFDAGMLSRPSALVTGAPGAGKSALVQRWVIGLAATGVQPVVLGDPKGEYAPAVSGLGGQVIRIGRGVGGLNVLEYPGLTRIADHPAHVAARLREAAHRRRLAIVSALLGLATGTSVDDKDRSVLGQALRDLDLRDPDNPAPGLDDLVRVLRSRGGERVARMINTLNSVIHHYAEVLGRRTTEPFNPSSPAVSFDISAINPRDDLLLAASLLACASYLDAHAEAEQITGHPSRRRWIVRDWSVLPPLDQPILGTALTELTCAQATTGTATVLLDPDQHPHLPHPPGQMSAIGTPWDIESLRRRLALSDDDTDHLRAWASAPAPGRFLLKRDLLPGLAVQVDLTDIERRLLEDQDQPWAPTPPALPAEPTDVEAVVAITEPVTSDEPEPDDLPIEPLAEVQPPAAPAVDPAPDSEQRSRTRPVVIGLIATLALALAGGAVVTQLNRPAEQAPPPVAQPAPPAGARLAVAAPAPATPGAVAVVAAGVPAAPGADVAIAAAAPAAPGGRMAASIAAPPRTHARFVVGAEVPRHPRYVWVHKISWTDAADWEQSARRARLAAESVYQPSTPDGVAAPSYTGTAGQPQYVAPQGTGGYAPAPQPAAPAPAGGGSSGGTSTEPGPPAPNQVFDPTNPDSQP